MVNTHLTVLNSSAVKYANAPVFRIPQLNAAGHVEEWHTVTYEQFNSDVELFARHWKRVLSEDGLPIRSIVGMWFVSSNSSLCVGY